MTYDTNKWDRYAWLRHNLMDVLEIYTKVKKSASGKEVIEVFFSFEKDQAEELMKSWDTSREANFYYHYEAAQQLAKQAKKQL